MKCHDDFLLALQDYYKACADSDLRFQKKIDREDQMMDIGLKVAMLLFAASGVAYIIAIVLS